jgi:hypothetical protein
VSRVPELSRLQWALIGLVWLASAFGTGAVLAYLYRRLHPSLSFYKLWALWTALVSVVAAAIFALGLL